MYHLNILLALILDSYHFIAANVGKVEVMLNVAWRWLELRYFIHQQRFPYFISIECCICVMTWRFHIFHMVHVSVLFIQIFHDGDEDVSYTLSALGWMLLEVKWSWITWLIENSFYYFVTDFWLIVWWRKHQGIWHVSFKYIIGLDTPLISFHSSKCR